MLPEKHFAGRQCVGKRAGQEDSYAFSEVALRDGSKALLLVVADGMGGHVAGARASELAVRKYVAAVHVPGDSMIARLDRALDVANEALAAASEEDPELEGFGTTLLAAALTPEGLEWVSVGDSPLFLFREGELRRLNEDHSFRSQLAQSVASGEISAEKAATSPLRGRLRSALAGAELTLIDMSYKPVPLQAGDIVLACSDGIFALDDAELAAALAASDQSDASEVAEELLRLVVAADWPKQDNATVAIIKP